MHFSFNEAVKHRVIGFIVIISIAAIFLPAILKKSNYRFDEHTQIAVRLPPKPKPPKVAIPPKQEIFEATKEPLLSQVEKIPTFVSPEPVKKLTSVVPTINKKVIPAKTLAKNASKEEYAVQMGLFAHQKNAEALVKQLRSQGFTAQYTILVGRKNTFYKVTVGQTAQKQAAENLQKRIASNLKMSGFIVKTKVG